MNDQDMKELLDFSLAQKALLRQKLRHLPVEDKVKILALMQRQANQIRRATGRPTKPEWSWTAVGLALDSPPPTPGSLLAALGIYKYAQAEQHSDTDRFKN